MKKLSLAALIALSLTACGQASSDSAAVPPDYEKGSLTVEAEVSQGKDEAPSSVSVTYSCREARQLCTAIYGRKIYEPVKPSQACLKIYGGDQKARLTGSIDAKRINLTFTRTDGCEIARWDALEKALAASGGKNLLTAARA